MPRLARIVITGVPHHVVQRGNNGQDVFFVDADRSVYLEFLAEHAERFGATVLGYCLMTNHVHLILKPEKKNALAKVVGRTHFRYAQHINRFHGRRGHLWEGRFHSCALDEEHFWRAMRYVEQNPVRAGVAGSAWDYRWSSAEAHVGVGDGSGLLDMAWWEGAMGASAWRRVLRRGMRKADVSFLRKNTLRGWPLAGDRAIAKFEKLLGRRLRPLPAGRPKGSTDKKTRRKRSSRKRQTA